MRLTASSATTADADLTTPHVDQGGVSDIVFATMHLPGFDFEPRIPVCQIGAFPPSSPQGVVTGSRHCPVASAPGI